MKRIPSGHRRLCRVKNMLAGPNIIFRSNEQAYFWLYTGALCLNLCTLWIYRMTSLVSCCVSIVNQNKWRTLLHDRIYRMTSLVSCCVSIVSQKKWRTLLHDRADVTTRYIHLCSRLNCKKKLVYISGIMNHSVIWIWTNISSIFGFLASYRVSKYKEPREITEEIIN